MKPCIVILFSLILLMAACDTMTPTGADSQGTGNDAAFRALARISQPDPLEAPVAISNPVTNLRDGTVTITTRYRAAPGFDELICMAPGSDTLWPGALLYGTSISDGEYLPVLTPRNPITFSISLVNLQGSISRTVANPSLSTVRQAITDLLAQNITGSTPARTAFSVSEVYNEDQLQIAIGGNFGSGILSVKSQFDFNNTSVQSRVLVKFVQVYYTIDIDLPESPSAFFANPAAAEGTLTSCGGVSPLYVSSVSYGRLALFSFESSENIEEMKAALSAAFSGLTSSGGFSLTVRQQEVIRNSVIKVTIIGGNGGMAVHSINGLEGLKAFVLTGGNDSRDDPGAPLAYRFRYLSDNATCKIVFASEYEVVKTIKAFSTVRVYDMSLRCDYEDDAGNSEEFYGTITVGCRIGSGQITWLQGFWNGEPAGEYIWNIPASKAWELSTWQSKPIPGGRDFQIPQENLADATLVITGHIREADTLADDDLGTYTLEIPVLNLEENTFTLNKFHCGLTRASIHLRACPL